MSALFAALDRALARGGVGLEVRRRVVRELIDALGGATVYVPVKQPGTARARVAAALATGAGIAEAAKAAGVSVRHARRLRDGER